MEELFIELAKRAVENEAADVTGAMAAVEDGRREEDTMKLGEEKPSGGVGCC